MDLYRCTGVQSSVKEFSGPPRQNQFQRKKIEKNLTAPLDKTNFHQKKHLKFFLRCLFMNSTLLTLSLPRIDNLTYRQRTWDNVRPPRRIGRVLPSSDVSNWTPGLWLATPRGKYLLESTVRPFRVIGQCVRTNVNVVTKMMCYLWKMQKCCFQGLSPYGECRHRRNKIQSLSWNAGVVVTPFVTRVITSYC